MVEQYFNLYRPEDKLTFGMYKGEDLRFIYVFNPSYVNWLICNNKHFRIILSDFSSIHTYPIPNINTLAPGGIVNRNGELIKLREYLNSYTDLMQHYNSPPEYGCNYFKFSDKALSIMKFTEALLTDSNTGRISYYSPFVYFTESYKGEFENQEYEDSISDEIEKNRESIDRMQDFIKDSNRDFIDEFNGFYHEDM